MDHTVAYIRICGLGMVFIVAYNFLGAVLRGAGDAKTPLYTVAVACAVNIVGDLLLVAGWTGRSRRCAAAFCRLWWWGRLWGR